MGGRRKSHSNKTTQGDAQSSTDKKHRTNETMRGDGTRNLDLTQSSGFPPTTGFQAAALMENLDETTAARIRRVALSLERTIERSSHGMDPKLLVHPSTGPVTRELLEVIAEYRRASMGKGAPLSFVAPLIQNGRKDKNAVLADGPHLFFGKPMIIKPWKASFDFCEESLRVIPIWVKFPNLPLNCWSTDSLSRIGSSLGVPLFADACTTQQDRISFARLLIEMDVTIPLPDCVWIEDNVGKVVQQKIGWQSADVDLQVVSSSEQFIHCWVVTRDHKFETFFTAVYGLHTVGHRQSLWSDLVLLSRSSQFKPWMVAGDFNSVLYSGDRINGNAVSDSETKDFLQCVADCDLHELHSSGWFFSWSSKGSDDPRVWSRIDRVFGNLKWMDSFPDISTKYLNPSISDHSPIVIPCVKSDLHRGRPFRFLNYLVDHTSFIGIVTGSWNMVGRGKLIEQIWCKLLRVSSSPQLLAADVDLVCKLKKRLGIEEQTLKQKSRVQWLKIHMLLDDDGKEITDPTIIKTKIGAFYKKLLGSAAVSLPSLDLPTIRNGVLLSPEKNWPILKKDVYAAVFDFFNAGGVLGKFNCTSITLVPKIPSPTSVSHFRPIACCTTVYKIVFKVLTPRLQKVVAEVVSEYQAGFVPGMSISDNITVATELIRGYNRAHMSPRCMVKVDLRKAYDSVEWPFLFMVLQELGFPLMFIHWIKGCVTTVSYSILVNGKPMPPFVAKKGLRQGDPLSPFLFAICMEYLSRCMKSLVSNPDFNFHPKCEKLQLTHLMFADDLLLFARGDLISLQLIFQAFTCFSKASGLESNMDKTEVYFSGVHQGEQEAIMEALGITKGALPFRYLGVPLASSKLTIGQCKSLIDKLYTRVTSWVSKKLSYADRLQLVKVILFSLQIYWSQIFMLPKKVVREIERICITYLWTGDTKTSKKSPIAWDSVCKPKVAGGQNVKNFHLWNKAVILKLLWALAFKPVALWVKWVNAYYIKARNMFTMPIPASASWVIKKIWNSGELLDSNADYKGEGERAGEEYGRGATNEVKSSRPRSS
ncbi:uncharacterized protein [Spinacia oleracea]|uniref:Reverse transcriptase domain-containing protein n=1 Tax=Spinacia oleracea TaxID=3562 RepID=A0ABM3QVZ9_SPIOL|nr:uncharacterized protein LOC110787845 [Spinacia oleracea]